MSTKTAIQWTDVTDNIIVAKQGGWWCRMISEGCTNCYAAKLNQSDYFHGNHLPYTGNPPELILRSDVIEGWARQRNPKRHFVASMTDVFGDWVPYEWVKAFLDGMANAPKQTFQVLTKRPEIAKSHIDRWLTEMNEWLLPNNIWIGTSVENQKRADERIPHLISIPAIVRFLSCEPLLGPIDLNTSEKSGPMADVQWVIVGGESGPNARPCNVEWIRDIVAQCVSAGVPCFVKQLGANLRADPNGKDGFTVWASDGTCRPFLKHPKGGDPAEWPEDLRVRQFPKLT